MAAVTVSRVFDAPVEKVWAAWSNPELVKKWWGSEGFTAPHISMDFRTGGSYLFAMHGPAGTEFDKDMRGTGTYREIAPKKWIVCTDSFANADGNVVSPAEYGMGELPREMQVTIEFEQLEDDKTRLTIVHEGAPSGPQHDGMKTGWSESLEKLAAAL